MATTVKFNCDCFHITHGDMTVVIPLTDSTRDDRDIKTVLGRISDDPTIQHTFGHKNWFYDGATSPNLIVAAGVNIELSDSKDMHALISEMARVCVVDDE